MPSTYGEITERFTIVGTLASMATVDDAARLHADHRVREIDCAFALREQHVVQHCASWRRPRRAVNRTEQVVASSRNDQRAQVVVLILQRVHELVSERGLAFGRRQIREQVLVCRGVRRTRELRLEQPMRLFS